MTSCSRLRYLEAPARATSASGSSGPGTRTLVLLHAFPLGARMWEPQHVFAAHGWRVVMPQFRGFDCTKPDPPDVSSLEDYAGDIADLLDTLGVNEAVFTGLSMGGYVAFELYRHAPELFVGLVLANTRAEADSPEARANRDRMITRTASDGTSAVADEMAPKLLGETTRRTHPSIEARVRAMILANQPSPIQAALRAMMTRHDSTPLLRAISVPALVITGEEDTLIPPSASASMVAAIPHAELVHIPMAGHLSSLEQPQAFNTAVLGFLGRL